MKNNRWISLITGICIVIGAGITNALIKGIFNSNKTSTYSLPNSNLTNKIQEIDVSSDTSICFFNTKKLPQANGINLNIYRQCKWETYSENLSKIPSLLNQFLYSPSDSLTMGESVNISRLKVNLDNKEIEKITSEKFIRENLVHDQGTYISSEKVNINGLVGDEVIMKSINQSATQKAILYSIVTHLYYKNNLITLTLFVISSNDEFGSFMFNSNLNLFKRLIAKTEIIN